MKIILEVFSKISNGIFIGCLGIILVSWGLYEYSDFMMYFGLFVVVVGFILAVSNEERYIRKYNDLMKSNERLKERAKENKKKIDNLEDRVLDLSENLEDMSKDLKLKTDTINRFKKIKVSMLQIKE